MKKQDLTLTVLDLRTGKRTTTKYREHSSFLKALATNVNTPGCNVHEVTETILTLYPQKSVKGLFE